MIRRDKKYKLKTARNCVKGYPCGATCISAKKVCLLKNANYQDLLVLKGLMNAEDVVPVELRAKHSDRTGKQVVDIVLNETEAITKRIAKEQRKLEILRTQYEIAKAKYLRSNPNDTELKGWKANQKLLNRIAKVETGIHVLENDRSELTKSIIQVPEERRMSLQDLQIKPASKWASQILQSVYPAISAFIDKSLQPKESVILALANDPSSGTYYNHEPPIIMFNYMRYKKVPSIAHEYVHHLEKVNPELSAVVQAFFNKRTAGDRITLYDRYIVKEDKFIDPYMGRVYPDHPQSKEVLSVAIEHMLTNPYEFMKKDPEHFAFAYDALRGNFAELRKQYREFLP